MSNTDKMRELLDRLASELLSEDEQLDEISDRTVRDVGHRRFSNVASLSNQARELGSKAKIAASFASDPASPDVAQKQAAAQKAQSNLATARSKQDRFQALDRARNLRQDVKNLSANQQALSQLGSADKNIAYSDDPSARAGESDREARRSILQQKIHNAERAQSSDRLSEAHEQVVNELMQKLNESK